MQMRVWREEQGLTLAAVAKAVGVSVPTVHRWELRRADPRLSHIRKIEALTGGRVTAADFVGSDVREAA